VLPLPSGSLSLTSLSDRGLFSIFFFYPAKTRLSIWSGRDCKKPSFVSLSSPLFTLALCFWSVALPSSSPEQGALPFLFSLRPPLNLKRRRYPFFLAPCNFDRAHTDFFSACPPLDFPIDARIMPKTPLPPFFFFPSAYFVLGFSFTEWVSESQHFNFFFVFLFSEVWSYSTTPKSLFLSFLKSLFVFNSLLLGPPTVLLKISSAPSFTIPSGKASPSKSFLYNFPTRIFQFFFPLLEACSPLSFQFLVQPPPFPPFHTENLDFLTNASFFFKLSTFLSSPVAPAPILPFSP